MNVIEVLRKKYIDRTRYKLYSQILSRELDMGSMTIISDSYCNFSLTVSTESTPNG